MKKNRFGTALAAAALGGACLLGCAEPAAQETERPATVTAADTVGSLCASPQNGGEFCVPSSQDPSGAWNQAAAHGARPIQMWAKWPSDLTLDQLVSSAVRLTAWLGDVDRVVAYVSKQSAESYQASMAGQLGALLKQAKDRQAQLVAQPQVDPIGNLRKALNEKADAEKGPLLAAAAADKQSITAIQAVMEGGKRDLAPLQAQYATVVSQFTAYRATEGVEVARYTSLAQSASQSTLDTVSDAEVGVVAAARDLSTKPNDLALVIMRLAAEVRSLEAALETSLEPYATFMNTHGIATPDMTSSCLRSLDAMLAYIQARTTRSDATVNSLLEEIAARRQALVVLKTAASTRETIAQTELLKAATAFNDEATARIGALWKTPVMSTKLKLPYLAERYDQFTAFLQLQPLCDVTSAAWRETGCVALRRNFNTSRSYMTTTIPSLIRIGVSTMRTKGVNPQLLDAAVAKLTAGDVKAAALAYDAAVQSSEGT